MSMVPPELEYQAKNGGDVVVNVRPEYFDGGCPYPVAFLWIRGDLFDSFPCGVVRRRVKWLPLWFPFNGRYDHSIYAQLACVKRRREFGQQILEAMQAA